MLRVERHALRVIDLTLHHSGEFATSHSLNGSPETPRYLWMSRGMLAGKIFSCPCYFLSLLLCIARRELRFASCPGRQPKWTLPCFERLRRIAEGCGYQQSPLHRAA